MAATADWYEPAPGPGVELTEPPRLASWNSSEHPDQLHLRVYLDAVEASLAPRLVGAAPPQALRLDVGLPADTPLLENHDLDNYLYPLAQRLSKWDNVDLVTVVGTKRHTAASYLSIATARHTEPPSGCLAVRTTASSTSPAYKEQIREQVGDLAELTDGPVHLEIAFTVSPQRNWLNLWKPTIDALGRLLGSDGQRPWHPRDGRVTHLALHCTHDTTLGNDVLVTVHTPPAPQTRTMRDGAP
jgi:hypothetical protein